jgi:hypothetical protein
MKPKQTVRQENSRRSCSILDCGRFLSVRPFNGAPLPAPGFGPFCVTPVSDVIAAIYMPLTLLVVFIGLSNKAVGGRRRNCTNFRHAAASFARQTL